MDEAASRGGDEIKTRGPTRRRMEEDGRASWGGVWPPVLVVGKAAGEGERK